MTMYYIIENYDIYRGTCCLIRSVPVETLDWEMLKREGLTAVPCES